MEGNKKIEYMGDRVEITRDAVLVASSPLITSPKPLLWGMGQE